MVPDEMTTRALLAALAAKNEGFHATAEAFLSLARNFAFDGLEAQYSFGRPSGEVTSNGNAPAGAP